MKPIYPLLFGNGLRCVSTFDLARRKKTKHILRGACNWLICLSVACLSATANAADITSTWNGATANWTSSNWFNTPNVPFYPNNGNGGFTYNATVSSGTVTLNQDIAIDNLAFSWGVIQGNANLELLGSLNWNSGRFAGTGTTTMAGGSWSGGDKYLESRTLEIHGNVNWSSGEIFRPSTSANHGTMIIKNGATFTASGAQASNRNIDVNLHVEAGGKFIGTGPRGTFIAHQFFAGPGGHVMNNGIIEAAANTHVSLPGGYGDGTFIVRENASMIVMLLDANEFQYTGDVILDNGYFDVYLFNDTGTTLEVEFLLPATLRGTGEFKVDKLINSRLIAPGQSIGHLDIRGDYEQAPQGELEIEVYGKNTGQFDTLNITGDAALGGILTVDASNLTPGLGQSIAFLTAGSLTGTFDSIRTVGNNNVYFKPIYNYVGNTVSLQEMSRGDMNGDGVITPADYDLFVFGLMNNSSSKFFNKCNCNITPQQGGDFNGNGRLDFDDIPLFQQSLAGMGMSDFGLQMAFERYYSNVPEPSTAMLVLLSQFLWVFATPRRPKRGESAERLF